MRNSLFLEQAYLNGKFISSDKTFEIFNPATQKALGQLPDLSVADCYRYIQTAEQAWHLWKKESLGFRSQLIRKLNLLIEEHKNELAEIMTLESGKPIRESLTEVDYANSFLDWFAEEGKRAYGETIPSINGKNHLMTIKQSIGVVAAITPWNFPLAMITRKLAPALVAGCTLVLKPASQTPFTAIALAKLADMAGFPNAVFNVITSTDSKGIGKALATSDLVRKISFTGSTAVGKTLMEQAASTIKRISLELGGNAPMIIFQDANIDQAVAGSIAGKFRNTGQTCVSINRFYVHETIYKEFCDKLTIAVKNLVLADGLNPESQVGPLINQKGLEKVQSHVADAVAHGAKIETGGETKEGLFYQPTVLSNVHPDSLIAKEETFGPVCALFKFSTEEEVLQLANNTAFGLAAYFYSDNVARCFRVAQALEAGMIGINTGLISNASAPFGGVKQSGLGREGSKYGLDEYMELKYLCFAD